MRIPSLVLTSLLVASAALPSHAAKARKGKAAKVATDSLAKARQDSLAKAAADTLGQRSPESILRVIRTHQQGFRFAADKYRNQGLDLSKGFSATFTIDAKGDIKGVSVAKGTGNADLDADLLDRFRRMKFDQIEKGNVTVTYAISLK